MTFFDVSNLTLIWDVVVNVVAVAAAVAAITPTPKDNAIVAKVRGFIDILALNVWNAKKK